MSWIKNLIYAFITLLAFYLLARFLRYALTNWTKRFIRYTKTEIDDRIIETIKTPLYYIIILSGLTLAIDILSLPSKITLVLEGLIYIGGVSIVAFTFYRVIDLTLSWYLEKVDTFAEGRLKKEFLPLIEKLLFIFVFIVGLIMILKHFNYDILSLVTALGVGSLAIGFAAKDTLANMISGFTIMLDRPFRVGDRIQLSSGEIGDVTEIGLRSTKIKTFDHTIIVVPNTELVNMRLINYCYPDTLIKGRVDVGIAYGSDVEKAKAIMIEIASSVEDVLKDPPPMVFFNEFGDSALLLFMRFWVNDYQNLILAKDKINMLIKKRFEEEGIEIPFPMRTVILKKEEQDG